MDLPDKTISYRYPTTQALFILEYSRFHFSARLLFLNCQWHGRGCAFSKCVLLLENVFEGTPLEDIAGSELPRCRMLYPRGSSQGNGTVQRPPPTAFLIYLRQVVQAFGSGIHVLGPRRAGANSVEQALVGNATLHVNHGIGRLICHNQCHGDILAVHSLIDIIQYFAGMDGGVGIES